MINDLDYFKHAANNCPVDDFEGFTAYEMHGLLYFPFDEKKSPLSLNTEVESKLISKSSFYNHIIKYLEHLRENQPLKLTQKGNLPRKFCRELFDMGLIEGEMIISRNQITREHDSLYIHAINVFTRLAGLTKKINWKISLTKKSVHFTDNKVPCEIYNYLFKKYVTKFNWGYSDGYPQSWIIQGSFGFTIFLVQKYGNDARNIEFYSDKFLRAFPSAIQDYHGNIVFSAEEKFQNCYYLRVFKRFLKRFGLVNLVCTGDLLLRKTTITKTELIDPVINWRTI